MMHRDRIARRQSSTAEGTHALDRSARKDSASRGAALEPAVRGALEPRFGFDFSDVRVHADAAADRVAGDLDARAVTVGRDIYFAQNEYDASRPEGLHLIAHELTHVVQQHDAEDGDPLAPPAAPSSAMEMEADAAGALAIGGQDVAVAESAPVAPARAPNEATPAVPEAWRKMMQNVIGSPHAAGGEHEGGEKEGEEGGLFWNSHVKSPAGQAAWEAVNNPAVGFLTDVLGKGGLPGLPGMEGAGTLGKVLGPLGFVQSEFDLLDAITGKVHGKERVEKGVEGGLGMFTGGVGTADLLGFMPEITGGMTMGEIGAAGAGGILGAGASVAGAGVGGYELGKMALNKGINPYAKEHNLFGNNRDSTEAAADAGVAVSDYFHDSWAGKAGDVFGDIAGGATSIVGSWGTAGYTGLRAAGGAISDFFSGPSILEQAKMAIELKEGTQKVSEQMGADISAKDLQEEEAMMATRSSSVAHEDAPPPPPAAVQAAIKARRR